MAQGLRCPHCGHKHPVDELPGTPTFRCAGCGQVLKTPRQYRVPTGPQQDTRRSVTRAPSTYQRPPARTAPVPRVDAYAGEATEALPTVGPPRKARPAPAPNGAARPVSARPLAVPLRVLVWLVTVPLGLLVVVLLARWTGLLTGNNLFDVVSGSGIGRYVRLFAIAPFAALVIATTAHFAIERLPVVLARRRARRAASRYDDPYDDRRGPGPGGSQRAGRPAGRRTTS
jgi:hypothetical protein